jgi:hypothetical protein
MDAFFMWFENIGLMNCRKMIEPEAGLCYGEIIELV